MVYVVTGNRFDTREFRGAFRSWEDAKKYIDEEREDKIYLPEIFPDPSIEIGAEPKTVYTAGTYVRSKDLFDYAGMFDDRDVALRKSNNHLAAILPYTIR